jgi:2-dehydro-3-deoxyphosphogalactonate aldolase
MTEYLKQALSTSRVVPALRGLSATEAHGIAETFLQFGVSVLEVPVRTTDPAFSPIETQALEALEVLLDAFRDKAVIVAGTVTRDSDLDTLQHLGVSACLSLNLQTDLVQNAVRRGMDFIPGVETVTEAIEATRAGAVGLKLFPAVMREPDGGTSVRLTPGYVSYLCRFLSLPVMPSGNAFEQGIAAAYLRSGAIAINVGAQLYQPGISLEELSRRLGELARQLEGSERPVS